MNYEFVYVFSLSGKVAWSGESARSLVDRYRCDEDSSAAAEEFVMCSTPGDFQAIGATIVFRCRQ